MDSQSPPDVPPPHYRKIVPHPGTFYLVSNEAAREILTRRAFGEPDPSVWDVWALQLPNTDMVFSFIVLFRRGSEMVERWFSASEMNEMSVALPEPKDDVLDSEKWAAGQIEEIDRLQAAQDAEECPFSSSSPAVASALADARAHYRGYLDLLGRLRRIAGDLHGELRKKNSMLRYYIDSRATWQEHCAASANKYADERDEARQRANQLLDRLEALDRRVEDQKAKLRSAAEQSTQIAQRAEEAERALRKLRGEANLVRFCKKIPAIGEIFEVEPGPFRDLLVTWTMGSGQVHRVTIQDTYMESVDRVRVCCVATPPASRFFTASQIEELLAEAEAQGAN